MLNRILKTSLLLLCIAASTISAQWSTDPTQNAKVAFGGILPKICIDGSGGCYIVWETGASGNRRLLRMQHLDRFGYKTMPDSLGMPLGGLQIDQATPFFVEYGGDGTALVFFYDTRIVNNRFTAKALVQRVDAKGNLLWGNEAVPLNRSDSTQLPVAFQVEDDGSAIGFWAEDRDGDGRREMYGNRISPDGQLLWGENGKKIAKYNEFDVTYTKSVRDSRKGVYLAYIKGSKLVVQHLNSDGNFLWPEPLEMPVGISGVPVSDNMGGFFWVAHEQIAYRPSAGMILRTRVFRYNNAGESLWDPEGVAITDSAYNQTFTPEVLVNGTEDVAIIYRALNGEHDNIFVQRLDFDGNLLYPYGGIAVSNFPSTKAFNTTCMDSEGNIITVWKDIRAYRGDLYAQSLSQKGSWNWRNEAAVSLRSDSESSHVAASDGAGGCIVAWYEIGTGSGWGIWVQQISRNGNLGEVLSTSIASEAPSSRHSAVPLAFELFPNPFRDSTQIEVSSVVYSPVTVQIFDITGRLVRTWHRRAGKITLQWDGTNQTGKEVSNGLYFLRFQSKGHVVTGKVLLIR